MIHVCVPVLKRYDLLRELLLSLRWSTVKPETAYIIDNGGHTARLNMALSAAPCPFFVEKPKIPMGVAESWNWFLQNVPQERLIVNDDVTFAPESLEKMAASRADLAFARGVGFSCFLMRDSCIEKVGFFDETISPGYGYYEDEDYLQRLDGKGTRQPIALAEDVDCGVTHRRSSTLEAASQQELSEHHRKFLVAQRNYMTKWNISDAEMFAAVKGELV